MLQSVGGLVPFHFIPKQCYWFRSYQEAAMQSWEGFYIAVSVSESPGAIFAINAVGKISHSTYLHISASIGRSSNCKTNLILCFLYFSISYDLLAHFLEKAQLRVVTILVPAFVSLC